MKKVLKKIRKIVSNFRLYKEIKKIIVDSYLYKIFFVASFKKAHEFAYYYEKEKICDNFIFYSSQCGETWNGNPRAILDYLLNDDKYKNFFHVILYKKLNDKEVLQYKDKYKNVIFIQPSSKLYAKYAEMCKYLIVDNTLSPYFIKKEGQIYVNSWHSTLLKPLGRDTGLIWESSNISKNCLQIDYFVTPNKFTSDLFFRAYYSDNLFQGEIIDVGYPRNDMIYNANKKRIKELLKLSDTDKLIIYAPTWRGTISNVEKQAAELFDKYYQMKEALKDDYVVLFRPHIMTYKYLTKEEKKHIVPMNIDTNELLAVTDILITDYSGIFFDFLNTKKPIILFPFDKDKYLSTRNSKIDFYLSIDDIPGPVCYDVSEVIQNVKNIEKISRKYSKKYNEYIKKFVSHDDGNATKRVVEKIFNNVPKKKIVDNRKKILICPGNMNANGVTESFLTLLDNIDYKKYNVSVLLENKNKNLDRQLRINQNANVFYYAQYLMYKNLFEHFWVYLITRIGKKKFISLPKKFCIRNVKSRIYNVDFDTIIEYHGYNPMNAMLHSVGVNANCKKLIYLHADMNLDRITKNKKIGRVFTFYPYYDKLVCVSKGSYEANLEGTKNYILKKYHIDLTDKFNYVYNLVNIEKINNGLKSDTLKYNENNYYCDNKKGNIIKFIRLPRKDEISFISIGRLSPEKNHKLVIKAFSRLVKDYQNVNLYIVGDGILRDSLSKMITKLGLQEKVILTGFLSNPYFLLNHCDCFVFPSSYEGMGLSALEASILKKFVIASNIKGVSDFINSDNGVLVKIKEVDIYNAMLDFMKNKKKILPIDGKKFNKNALNLFYKVLD